MADYDAFVSYSHAKDKPIAAALQSVIQTLGKPWYRRRALRVFRDDTSLSATPQLWPSIEQALSQSRFLVLLASPEAAASPWVNKEVAYWLDNKGADTLLIAVTDGALSWDDAVGDFVWREGMPLPPVLTGRFISEPKWVDLRAYRDGANPRDSRFIEAGADFAAAIHGMPKEDLLSQEVRQQRRALRLAWSAAGSLLILSGLAGWQWKVALDNERAATEQRLLAQAQRERAERSLAAATQTANSLVFDLAREFRERAGMPADLVRQILDRAQGLQRQLTESGETTPALRRTEAKALQELVRTLLALGDTTAAFAAAERARAILEELSAANPGDTEWQRDLSISHDWIGDVLVAAGRREEALAAHRKSLVISERLAATDPGNTEWQRDLSITHDKIGDLLRVAGRREEALAAYSKSLAIRERLTAADPGNMRLQHDLSIIHRRIGNMLRVAGRWEEALAAYRRGLAIAETLVAVNPSNTLWQGSLSTSHILIGDVLVTSGQREEALAEYNNGLAIRERLTAADPGNTEWRRELSISHDRIGDVLVTSGQREEALAEYNNGLAIRERLAAADPGNTDWQRDLSVSHNKIGDVLGAAGRREEALAVHRKSLAIRERLTAADPGNTEWQRDLSISHDKIGNMLAAAGRREEALAVHRKSLAIRETLAAADPGNVGWQADLVGSLYKISSVSEPADARALLRRAITIIDALSKSGALTAAQQNWPESFRRALAELPPEQAEAQ